jgi:hypothetical protein
VAKDLFPANAVRDIPESDHRLHLESVYRRAA